MEEIILLCSDEGRSMLDWPRAPDPRLVLDGTKYFVDRKFQWSEMLLRPEGSEWNLQGARSVCLLKAGRPQL